MIVIGVAPGLKALSYSVIDLAPAIPVIIDKDVLLGPRIKEGLVDLVKKAYVHYLILDVVFERELEPIGRDPRPKAVLAIGPACNPKEPVEHVSAVRLMLTTLTNKFKVPVVQVDEPELKRALQPAPRESWLRVSNRLLSEPLDTDEHKIVMAVVVGLAGAALYAERCP
jgi:hypothetical protein